MHIREGQKIEAETGIANKPEKPKNTKEKAEDNLLLKNARETEFQTPCLHNHEVISICGFEPSSLWEFLMVAIGN